MKIAVLSRDPRLYTTSRLVQAAKLRGHEIDVLDYMRCSIEINAEHPDVVYSGEPVEHYDAIIPRISAAHTYHGTTIVRQFEMMGWACCNSSQAIIRTRDKLECLQVLGQADVPIPKTGFAHAAADLDDLIDHVGGPPVIIKLLKSTHGVGVLLGETRRQAEAIVEAFRGFDQQILLQEFIPEAEGTDLRCLVVGDKVVAAIRRQAAKGEFRANIHRGATATVADLTNSERELAIDAAKTVGLQVAGVDILNSARGPLVLEINSSPGFEAAEKATGVEIAEEIIRELEKQISGNKERIKSTPPVGSSLN
ncbi:30S ribosomal protein S6--L-glutamate ligase [Calycomorphotria hydatis]|uniref:Ribosomal protein S6 modification protein n=1 Tax=Calycomorphotria hydatis TaxID=2528027 RepID=A0A517T9K3_9PLAN|nr:30S ribosomal protein S6--L-glutamate ligase [Calycomorphotria hydatis]QDT65053.1 Ribosomal protein S6 modification protein [Calycomorphotria hydatis]